MKRSKYNLSHYHLTSFDMGELVPVGCVEVLPGDSFQANTSALVRVTPQVKPVMHPCYVHIHHFFVPNRLLWSGWEDFITGESATPPPTISGGSHTEGSLSDYLGVYNDASNDFSALPLRAYNKVFNEYYRDQDLDSEVSEDTDTVQKVRWAKDYFTTARPWSQKGTAVSIPLGSTAPVTGIGISDSPTWLGSTQARETGESSASTFADATSNIYVEEEGSTTYPNIYADLSGATGADIREFREAFAMQRYQEARARYGSNYHDYLAYLGITGIDSRLQRPEYLAGGRQTVSFSEVVTTANFNTSSPEYTAGELKGHGIAAIRSNRFRRFFPEHGWFLTLMFVRPKSIYTQALPKKFSKVAKEDYYQRELQHVGAQEVLNKELYAPHATPDGTFGYSTRYSEYFSEQSRVSSEYRNSTSYDWHMGRIFASDPALNSTFLTCDPTKRCFTEQNEDSLWVMVNNSIQARRQVGRSHIGKLA